MKQKKTYSEDFKKDALQLLKSSGKNRSAIEQDLGLRQMKSENPVMLL